MNSYIPYRVERNVTGSNGEMSETMGEREREK